MGGDVAKIYTKIVELKTIENESCSNPRAKNYRRDELREPDSANWSTWIPRSVHWSQVCHSFNPKDAQLQG